MNDDLYVDMSCMNNHVWLIVQTSGGEKLIQIKKVEFSLWITLSQEPINPSSCGFILKWNLLMSLVKDDFFSWYRMIYFNLII